MLLEIELLKKYIKIIITIIIKSKQQKQNKTKSKKKISQKIKIASSLGYPSSCFYNKEAIQIRLHSHNINRDNGIEIPEAWMPTIRKHNSRSTTKRTREGTSSANRNNKDRNTPITANQRV